MALYRMGRGCVPSIDMLPGALLTLYCMALYRMGRGCVSSIDMLPGALLTLHCMALYRMGRGGVPSIDVTWCPADTALHGIVQNGKGVCPLH